MVQFVAGTRDTVLETRQALGPTLFQMVLVLRMHEGILPLSICFHVVPMSRGHNGYLQTTSNKRRWLLKHMFNLLT
jgi:hypothetical protein